MKITRRTFVKGAIATLAVIVIPIEAIASVLEGREQSVIYTPLLTINAPHIHMKPVRIVNNHEDIISRNKTFKAYPFEITLPCNDYSGHPNAKITIDNVSPQIANLFILSTWVTITIEIVRMSEPDTVELSYAPFMLGNSTVNAYRATGDLIIDEMLLPTPMGMKR